MAEKEEELMYASVNLNKHEIAFLQRALVWHKAYQDEHKGKPAWNRCNRIFRKLMDADKYLELQVKLNEFRKKEGVVINK